MMINIGLYGNYKCLLVNLTKINQRMITREFPTERHADLPSKKRKFC